MTGPDTSVMVTYIGESCPVLFTGDRRIFKVFRLFSLLVVLFESTSRKKPFFAALYELDSVSP